MVDTLIQTKRAGEPVMGDPAFFVPESGPKSAILGPKTGKKGRFLSKNGPNLSKKGPKVGHSWKSFESDFLTKIGPKSCNPDQKFFAAQAVKPRMQTLRRSGEKAKRFCAIRAKDKKELMRLI